MKKIFLLILLVCLPTVLLSQCNLMLNMTKNSVKIDMFSCYPNLKLSSYNDSTLVYKTDFRTVIYNFKKHKRGIFKRWICEEISVEVPNRKVDGFIRDKEDKKYWTRISGDIWKYNNDNMDMVIFISRTIYNNKQVFTYKEEKNY